MQIEIRPARATDANTVVAFNIALADESEGKLLDRITVEHGVAAVLADPGKGRYYIAERDGVAIGQLMLTFEWSDWRNGTFWWIQSVYVNREYRGQGVFSRLYRFVERQAREDDGACGLRLYVDKGNTHAAQVYRALGMTEAHYDLFEIDFAEQGAAA